LSRTNWAKAKGVAKKETVKKKSLRRKKKIQASL